MKKQGILVACAGRNDGGPETYERHLVRGIAQIDKENSYDVFCFNQKAIDSFGLQQDNIRFTKLWPQNRLLSLSVSLPLAMQRRKIDQYHATFIPAPFSKTPSIFTMHDVSPLTHPEFYPKAVRARLLPLIKRGLNQSEAVICISEDCRQTTAEHFNIPLEKMHVVHHGLNPSIQRVPKADAKALVAEKYGVKDNYILYLGKLEARKNIVRIIEAFAEFHHAQRCDTKLVLAGRRFWDLDGIDEAVARHGLQNKIIETGFVPDEHLASLYSGAEVFLFPTLWEGFGFPIIEAFACGTPVITSTVSCLPEIAGGAAALVDPTKVADITDSITKIINDDALKAAMSQRGLERVKQFTWEKTAQQTIDIYKQL